MRIAVWHNLYSGGGLRALQTHVRGLLDRGHSVEAWCVGERPAGWAPFGPRVREHRVPLAATAGWRGATPRWLRDIQAMEAACERCAREMEAGGFDLAFANTCQSYAVPFVMRYLRRLPRVLYLQEPRRALYEAQPVLPWVGEAEAAEEGGPAPLRELRQVRRWYALRAQARREWLNVHACDTVLVNSYYSRESVLRAYARDSDVCYLGVETELFRPGAARREPLVVGLGALDRAKGVHLAVRAVAGLAAPRPALAWVADRGDATYAREVRELASGLGVELRVMQGIADAELSDILGRASLMLYTSRLEPFGLAPLEANACGTPVVAIAEGGVRETVLDGVNGLLADARPDSLAAAMARLLGDAPFARRLGDRAAEHVREHWTADASVRRLEAHLLRARHSRSERKVLQ
jgi:glycosyltransferase involved in cell wall biosynthesis